MRAVVQARRIATEEKVNVVMNFTIYPLMILLKISGLLDSHIIIILYLKNDKDNKNKEIIDKRDIY